MTNFNESRFRFYLLFIATYIIYNLIIRTTLLFLVYDKIDLSILNLGYIFTLGLFYDLISGFYLSIPIILYLLFSPRFIYNSKFHKILTSIFFISVLFGFGFLAISEHVFWDEFGVRFNFIAVDYLVYTKEVIGNIKESYPINLIVFINLAIALLVFIFLRKTLFKAISYDSFFKQRLKYSLITFSLPILSFLLVTSSNLKIENKYEKNLAYNGLYQLFSSFRNNVLDYNEFYKTKELALVLKNYKTIMKEKNISDFKNSHQNDIRREIKNTGIEKDKNIVMIVVESLSSEFLGAFGDKRGLTPNISSLANDSMLFTNLYATGTRTVRGMEALTLSIPPTPGRSIVKRPNNENMFSSGFIFKKKGYDTSFIYGGHGYFDNMNSFFSSNGFDNIIDRTDMNNNEITFSNVWGVADENLLDKAIQYYDLKDKNKEKFFSFIMTTSNHRPYTYPSGKIDIPSKTGREGAVKYTDYAIGEFMKKAKTKTWFNNTIFIIVADHNASSAGKSALPLHKYRIPMIIYSPKNIKAQKIDKISSQIDLMPTLFSLLNWSYESKFYGKNILSNDFKPRALLGNYQKLALYRNKKLTVLSSDKTVQEYQVNKVTPYKSDYKKIELNPKDVLDTITYYQSASYFYKNKINRINN